MIRPAVSLAAVSVLCLFAAACGGDSGGSPSSPSPQPPAQDSGSAAAPPSSSSVSPLAGEDTPAQDNSDPAAPADGQATDAQEQTENYYGQPAPETRERDDPQAAWKARRDAAEAPAG